MHGGRDQIVRQQIQGASNQGGSTNAAAIKAAAIKAAAPMAAAIDSAAAIKAAAIKAAPMLCGNLHVTMDRFHWRESTILTRLTETAVAARALLLVALSLW